MRKKVDVHRKFAQRNGTVMNLMKSRFFFCRRNPTKNGKMEIGRSWHKSRSSAGWNCFRLLQLKLTVPKKCLPFVESSCGKDWRSLSEYFENIGTKDLYPRLDVDLVVLGDPSLPTRLLGRSRKGRCSKMRSDMAFFQRGTWKSPSNDPNMCWAFGEQDIKLNSVWIRQLYKLP